MPSRVDRVQYGTVRYGTSVDRAPPSRFRSREKADSIHFAMKDDWCFVSEAATTPGAIAEGFKFGTRGDRGTITVSRFGE